MTYHLASLRLCSIGDRSARFSDLTVSTIGVDGTPQDHIVWLRNGGGKSSLLSLFYALLLPRKYDFMGRATNRALTDYVDTGDTSHTIAMWHPATTGTLDGSPERVLVTGAVYEWKDQRRPANAAGSSEDLAQTYYAFFASPGVFDAHTLPVTDESGHRVRRNEFIARLGAQAAEHTASEFAIVHKNFGDWERTLVARGLDPDLFRSQKQMNHVEGDVENLFKFKNAKDFIDFLLKLTVSPEVTNRIADSVSMIANKISQKPAKVSERTFCRLAVDGLQRLAESSTEHIRRAAELEGATGEARALSARFVAAIRASESRRAEITESSFTLSADRARYNTERAGSTDLAALYRRRSAELLVAEAQEQLEHAERARSRAHRIVKVWQTARPLAERRDVADELEAARGTASEEARELAPLALIHDNHAAAYKTLLGVLADASAARAQEARTAAASARDEAVSADRRAEEARDSAGDAHTAAGKFQVRLDQYTEQLREAVEHQALPDVDADPAAHAAALDADRGRYTQKLERVQKRRAVRPTEQARLNRDYLRLTGERDRAQNDQSQLRTDQDRYEATAARLCGEARVIALLEASTDEPVNLWTDAETLVPALEREISRSDGDLIAEKVAKAGADRTVAVHTETGYLPSTLDADRVVRVLAGAGIDAVTGWEHLRLALPDNMLHDSLTETVLSRIGAGVVVSTDRADAARNALVAAEETTVALVDVFTAAAVGDTLSSRTREDGLGAASAWSGLAPGLVDPAAAGVEAEALVAASRGQAAFSTALIDARESDRELLREIVEFLQDCPAGHLPGLTARIADLDARLGHLNDEIAANDCAQLALSEADSADLEAETGLNTRIIDLERALARLAGLLGGAAHRREWEAARDAATARQLELTTRADSHRAASRAAADRGHQLDLEAHELDRDAKGYRDRAREVTYIGEPTAIPTPDDVAGHSLEMLRRRTDDARHAHDLPASHFRAAARVDDLGRRLGQLGDELPDDPDLLAEAETVLFTPAGQSRQNRTAALDAAEATLSECDKTVGQARGDAAAAKEILNRTNDPRRAVTHREAIEPTDSVHAAHLATEHEEMAAHKRQLVSDLEETIQAFDAEGRDLELRTANLKNLTSGLPDPKDTDTPVEVFDGDFDTGEAVKRELLAAVGTAQARVDAVVQRIADNVEKLRLTAADYADVPVKARERLRSDAPAVLAGNAHKLAASLNLRADQIDGDLAAIALDQAVVTQALAGVVADNFDMFRRTQRFSVLPDGLGGLSGRQLLKIRFANVAEESLRAQVDRVIEDAVAKGNKPDGMDLLMASTHAAAGAGGFTVKVLKPVRDLTPIEEDVAAMGKWSGGERLTACVALYCTIAKVRAVNAGHKDQSGGSLLLDNPIGRASHGPMVELQRRVAAAQGVQLIYATGLQDFDAVSQFPTITRLENRRGLAGRYKFVLRDDDDAITGARVAHTDRLEGLAGS